MVIVESLLKSKAETELLYASTQPVHTVQLQGALRLWTAM